MEIREKISKYEIWNRMKFIDTGIANLILLEPRVFGDSRGHFFESYNERVFTENGVRIKFVQDNQSLSSYGVIRGLHFQKEPYAQTKLVRVLSGRILDVAVDLRKNSPTYAKHYSVELSAQNKLQLLIPKGFAHGFSVLSETAEVMYKCDAFYHRESESGIIYNDSTLNIDWKIPTNKAVVSEKDLLQPSFSAFKAEIQD